MNLNTAIARATTHFLKSDKARTVDGHTLEFKRESTAYGDVLMCLTWGYHSFIIIPEDRPELIKHKFFVQRGTGIFAQIATRYYLDIFEKESKMKKWTYERVDLSSDTILWAYVDGEISFEQKTQAEYALFEKAGWTRDELLDERERRMK